MKEDKEDPKPKSDETQQEKPIPKVGTNLGELLRKAGLIKEDDDS